MTILLKQVKQYNSKAAELYQELALDSLMAKSSGNKARKFLKFRKMNPVYFQLKII